MAGGISIDFDIAGRRREKRDRAAALLETYIRQNPDISLAEAQEAMQAVDASGELPATFSTGRKLSDIRRPRRSYFAQNKDTGLLESVDLGEDVASGRADASILPFNPAGSGAEDANKPGRLIVQNQDGTFGYMNEEGREVPLGEGGFGGITKRDRIVKRPTARAPGRTAETPAQKAARDTIQKYMAAVDDYADPSDIPEALTRNMRSAAESLGMTVEDVVDVVKKRGKIAKLFGMEDVTRTTPVIRYGGAADEAEDMGADAAVDGGDEETADDGAMGEDAPPAGRSGKDGQRARAGFGSEEEVRAAYRSGKITKEKALRLLGF